MLHTLTSLLAKLVVNLNPGTVALLVSGVSALLGRLVEMLSPDTVDLMVTGESALLL